MIIKHQKFRRCFLGVRQGKVWGLGGRGLGAGRVRKEDGAKGPGVRQDREEGQEEF